MARKLNRNAYTDDGTPKYLRIYDNGGETVDRFTVVFTQIHDGYQHYLAMSASPFWPQGICLHDSVPAYQPIDRPSYAHLGRKIRFAELPEDCQRAVMIDYEELWGVFAKEVV